MDGRLRVLLDCRMATWTGVGRYTTGLARALAGIEGVELIQVTAAGEAPPVAARTHSDADAGTFSVPEPLAASKSPFSLGGARELARLAREVGAGRHPLPALPDADAAVRTRSWSPCTT